MAGVLHALASYIQNMLMDMVKEDQHMLLGVSGEINNMGIKLEDLKYFLADVDRKNITGQSAQAFKRELRDAMYDATDILDQCQLKFMERGLRHDVGCFNPLFFWIQNPLHANDIESQIKNLNNKLDDIKARSESFNFIKPDTYEDINRREAFTNPTIRETSSEYDESGLVGEKMEEDTINLLKILTKNEVTSHENKKVMVFAIVGVGGIGKTTLAQKIFNHDIIQHEFTKKIWLSVNTEFNEVNLLRRAIFEAVGDYQVFRTRSELQQILTEALNGHKIMLVMDDVWDHSAWENVLKAPLFDALARGSCILVTTRHDTVARAMGAEVPYHRVNKLKSDDAWYLLKKQVVRNLNDEFEVDKLKDIGMSIIGKCDGLPLAIKVMGGLLRHKRIRRRDWENILLDSMWSIHQMPQELNYEVYLSYNDLHPCLKSCFLHYSLLPKSTLFVVDDIVSMWISEGFIPANSHDLEELGREYYNELILRNLIEPDTKYTDLQVCNMHDTVRSFAQFMARDDALVAHNSEIGIYSKVTSQKFTRLSVEAQGRDLDELEWSSLQQQVSLRTLILIGNIKLKPGDSLAYFSSLRTLHLRYTNFDVLAESLHQLKHLRYLSLEYTNTSRLPERIGEMKFLQYISVVDCEKLVKLPSTIVKLWQLRYLNLLGSNINIIPRRFSGLTNLRILYGFPVHLEGDWCSLEELGSLSQLTRLHISRLENVPSSSSAIRARLGEKVRLSYLCLSCTSRLGEEGGNFQKQQHLIKEVFDELCPPPCLDNLAIKGYYGLQLPKWMISIAAAPLMNLRILTMEDLSCCTELPDGLSQLPSLELLQIHRAPAIKYLGPEFNSFYNNRYICSQVPVAFPRLRELNISEMSGWELWEWQEQAKGMAILEELLLEKCKLRRIPPGLAYHARALRKLYIYNVENLSSLENFCSVVYLQVFECHDMERICNFPKLMKLDIIMCERMNVLEGVPALQRFRLEDCRMKTLPGFLENVNPRYLHISCSLSLLTSMANEKSSREWDKCIHIQQVKAYTPDGDIPSKWYLLYTRYPFSMETNISRSVIAQEMADLPSEVEALERSYMEHTVLESILDGTEDPCNLKLSLLQLITDNFSIEHKIGQGGCGDVYKGKLQSGSVAVKRLFKSYTVEEKMFEQEIRSMMMVKHKNIVRFLGYCSDTQGHAMQIGGKYVIAEERERLLCFEYIGNGSLDKHINDELRGLEWHTRYQIVMGICEGLNYLHNEKRIIHMDLKPANILMDYDMVPKITDFGLSRLDGQSHTMSTKRLGSQGYCAPEYLWEGKLSNKSDIYSLGVIILEMVTGSKEKPNITKVLGRWKHRWNKSSEKIPLCYYQQVTKCLNLALLCIRTAPVGRPSILDIIHELNEIDIMAGKIIEGSDSLGQLISPSLDDMLGIKPLQIHFQSALDKETSCLIELTNDTDYYIAFHISPVSSLLQYSIEPEKGIVQPHSNCSVKITLQAQEIAPAHNQLTGEEFCVRSTSVDHSLQTTDITEDMFHEDLDKVVDHVSLPVVFDDQI